MYNEYGSFWYISRTIGKSNFTSRWIQFGQVQITINDTHLQILIYVWERISVSFRMLFKNDIIINLVADSYSYVSMNVYIHLKY